MAGIALELGVLAFLSRAMELQHAERPLRPVHAEPVEAHPDEVPLRAAQDDKVSPVEFITESGDAQARYYRARDERGADVVVGFYADGRVRLADWADRRFAGMVENGHADLLDIANNAWSELFLSVTPSGRMQLELRGGPYDAHVLTCEALRT